MTSLTHHYKNKGDIGPETGDSKEYDYIDPLHGTYMELVFHNRSEDRTHTSGEQHSASTHIQPAPTSVIFTRCCVIIIVIIAFVALFLKTGFAFFISVFLSIYRIWPYVTMFLF